jgi:hypothetical protein
MANSKWPVYMSIATGMLLSSTAPALAQLVFQEDPLKDVRSTKKPYVSATFMQLMPEKEDKVHAGVDVAGKDSSIVGDWVYSLTCPRFSYHLL